MNGLNFYEPPPLSIFDPNYRNIYNTKVNYVEPDHLPPINNKNETNEKINEDNKKKDKKKDKKKKKKKDKKKIKYSDDSSDSSEDKKKAKYNTPQPNPQPLVIIPPNNNNSINPTQEVLISKLIESIYFLQEKVNADRQKARKNELFENLNSKLEQQSKLLADLAGKVQEKKQQKSKEDLKVLKKKLQMLEQKNLLHNSEVNYRKMLGNLRSEMKEAVYTKTKDETPKQNYPIMWNRNSAPILPNISNQPQIKLPPINMNINNNNKIQNDLASNNFQRFGSGSTQTQPLDSMGSIILDKIFNDKRSQASSNSEDIIQQIF